MQEAEVQQLGRGGRGRWYATVAAATIEAQAAAEAPATKAVAELKTPTPATELLQLTRACRRLEGGGSVANLKAMCRSMHMSPMGNKEALEQRVEAKLRYERRDERASERQPTRADSAAMRRPSSSWPRKRMLQAQHASRGSSTAHSADAHRDAVALRQEAKLQRALADGAAELARADKQTALRATGAVEINWLQKHLASTHVKLLKARKEGRRIKKSNAW